MRLLSHYHSKSYNSFPPLTASKSTNHLFAIIQFLELNSDVGDTILEVNSYFVVEQKL